MAYERQTYGGRAQDRRLGDSAAARGHDVEEEPSELDEPEGLEGDDLEGDEDEMSLEAAELEDADLDDDESDEDEEEPASPLAEDAPTRRKRQAEAVDPSDRATLKEADDDDLDETPGVRTSGGGEIAGMSRTERSREFPSVPHGRRKPAKKPAAPKRRPS